MINVWFFGTPEPAAQILTQIFEAGDFKILAVVAQPDKATGRGHIKEAGAVKVAAEKRGIRVLQPESLLDYNPPLEIPRPDIFIVYQYGLIMPESTLSLAKLGAINLHPSALPRYRGATPLHEAILRGDETIGISIMLMDTKMDHGPILAQTTLELQKDELYETVEARATEAGAKLLIPTARDFYNGKIVPAAQNETVAIFCQRIAKDQGRVNWQKPAREIYNQYRAYHKWPGIFTFWGQKRLKFLKISYDENETSTLVLKPAQVNLINNLLKIGTASGSIAVHELQLEGGKPLKTEQFLAGHRELAGAILK
ncbi:MAG: methionyl-tRNA formyltransferase [Candidatus Magasanikbacteria bacterium]|nr:methionyl-tRNA formyltransferase [Candidatus Magasanikbacteria bacterium]